MPSKRKEAQRAKLKTDVDKWIEENGEPPLLDHTANKGWRGRQHTPMTVTQARLEHRWHTPHVKADG